MILESKGITIIFFIMLILSIFSSYGQIAISGKVVDAENMAIPGVTIVEKGTENSTFSDIEGDFKLQVTDSHSIIELHFLGYKPIALAIGKKRYLLVKLKEDCLIDFFDENDIWLGLSSDPVNNPLGGFFHMTYPLIWGVTLIGEIGYQSNLSDNYRLDTKLGVIHLITHCDYDMDLDVNYRNIKVNDKFLFKNYTIESKINFSRPRIFPNYTILYLGCGLSDMNKSDFHYTNQMGYLLGIGTKTSVPLLVEIGVKAIYWTNFWEWKGEIARKMKYIVVAAEFDIIDTSFTMGIKIGYRFNYKRPKYQ